MKIGIRKISIKGRISARISPKKRIRSKFRVPRGSGLATNPKKLIYNRVYNRTSISADGLSRLWKKFSLK